MFEVIVVSDESQLILNTTESWEFQDDDDTNIEFNGNATTSETIQNTKSLVLDGYNDYAKIDVNSTNHITQMNISTWVKTDYSDGYHEFTICLYVFTIW